MRFSKICTICGKKFTPTGRLMKVCDECRGKHWSKRRIKEKP